MSLKCAKILPVMFFLQTVAETAGDIDDSLIGGNKSAEAPAEEEYSSDTTYGVNIVLYYKLKESVPMSKKDYTALFKVYAKKILDRLNKAADEEKDPAKKEEAEKEAALFKNGMGNVLKKLKEMWKDLIPYTGESMSEEAMICFLNYRENGDPYMIFFKHGLMEEKQVSFLVNSPLQFVSRFVINFAYKRKYLIGRSYKNDEFDWLFHLVIVT